MKKTVCIYPEDPTTDFLIPLYKHICTNLNAVGLHSDTTDEDDSLDRIYQEIKDAENVLFLGHGTSEKLYGSCLGNVVFEDANSDLLSDKRLLLLSCNSDQFISNCKLTDAVGFAFLPTSLDDARARKKLHDIQIENLLKKDIDRYNAALVNALINTLSEDILNDFSYLKNVCISISAEK